VESSVGEAENYDKILPELYKTFLLKKDSTNDK
jgi:hypothetical protein